MRSAVVPALAVFAACCGGSPTAPAASSAALPAPAPSFAGTFTGTGVDSGGTTSVTWVLAQSGDSVTGTVKTQAIDPNDGSCNSCHRNKSGTVTGTVSNGLLALRMSFAAGADGDPTPICSQTLNGSATSASDGSVAGDYAGADTCEGALTSGTLKLTRR